MTQAQMAMAGGRMASAMESLRGETATVGGRAVKSAWGKPSRSDIESLPDGDRNAADSLGGTMANLSPSAFSSPAQWPKYGDMITRALTGEVYTVLRTMPEVAPGSSTVVSVRSLCYRTPTGPQDAETDAQAAEWADPPAQ